ncbi:hypothetical protein IWX49DRAFT_561609 [Phyllosticta citricarpa]
MQSSLRRLSRIRLPFATARRLGIPPTFVTRSKTTKSVRAFSTFITPRRQADQTNSVESSQPPQKSLIEALPLSCPGCGAPSQTVTQDLPGYYSADMKHVKVHLKHDQEHNQPKKREDDIFTEALANLDPSLREQLGVGESEESRPKPAAPLPLCYRCHRLSNHREGVPIDHPSINAIRAMIQESPHKRNRIYHVIDAADFPMSVIPDITRALDISPLRSRGRRASRSRWQDGKYSKVEFIITRADLLVPQEDMSRRLMAYMVDVLREKIGREYRDNIRLGNVHLVSAQRGWWTKPIKQKILKRGGANWFVGKVNVGKSSLFEVVFPKGEKDYVDVRQLRQQAEKEKQESAPEEKDSEYDKKFSSQEEKQEAEESKSEFNNEDTMAQADDQALETSVDEATADELIQKTDDAEEEAPIEKDFDAQSIEECNQEQADEETAPAANSPDLEEAIPESIDTDEPLTDDQDLFFSETSLLPPPRKEVDYPIMPMISHLPGTTASPIRIPFARGRGELIDLPGLDRAGMDQYVAPQYRSKLLLKSRQKAERIVLKPHESLVLGGGLVRITPATTDLVYLVTPFVELPWHKSSTEKAIARERADDVNPRSGLVNWADEAARDHIRSAGVVPLSHDVTKMAAGPLGRKDVTSWKTHDLPFIVWGVDVLIEGLGWVEVTAQTRRFTGKIRATKSADAGLRGKETTNANNADEDPSPLSQTETAMLPDDRNNADDEDPSPQPQAETATSSDDANADGDPSPQPQAETATSEHDDTSSSQSPNPTNTITNTAAAAVADNDGRGPIVPFPQIDVFSPYGKCIGVRRPLMGSVLNAPRKAPPKERPWQSMKAVKTRRPKGTATGEAPDTVARGVRRKKEWDS